MEPTFRYPYVPGEEIELADDLAYTLGLDADDYCLGYSLLPIASGPIHEPLQLYGEPVPQLQLQPWFQKDYSPERVLQFWNDETQQGQNLDHDTYETAVILLADPKSLVADSLQKCPRSHHDLQTLSFTGRGRPEVILTDGHARLRAMLLTAQNDPSQEFNHVEWPVRVFDIGK